jgi:hypothetical protein
MLAVDLQKFKKDRQCRYKSNIEVRSLNHCFRGNAISITYSECVSVALVTQHAKCMLRILICGLLGSKILPNYLVNVTIFGKTLLKIKCVS